MRLVQVSIPTGKRRAVLDTLDEREIDYVVTDENSHRKYTDVIYFPLPSNAVEEVLESLRKVGLNEDAYTVVLDAQTVISRDFEKLEKRYAEQNDEPDRIAREEIQATARDLIPAFRIFLVMAIISAVVATAGLLLNSPAVVVGSMVIAPLFGPAMATSVGTVTDTRELFVDGVKYQVAGFAVAILSSVAFAAVAKSIPLLPPGLNVISLEQVSLRQEPGILSLVVALGAGVAGALSLTAGISTALVGVMIAAALIPPTAAIGIGVVWNSPSLVVGSAVLVLINTVSINLAALVVLWYSGYRPTSVLKEETARKETVRRVGVLAATIGLLSLVLIGATYADFQSANFESAVREEVRSTLTSPEYQDTILIGTTVEAEQSMLFNRPERVVVTVGQTDDEKPPDLAATLQQRITQRTGRTVDVQVRFVDVQSVASG